MEARRNLIDESERGCKKVGVGAMGMPVIAVFVERNASAQMVDPIKYKKFKAFPTCSCIIRDVASLRGRMEII